MLDFKEKLQKHRFFEKKKFLYNLHIQKKSRTFASQLRNKPTQ